jgi:signal transduction histidine kinase
MNAPWKWRPRGAASLRTRSFVVIIIAVLIPSMCLAGVAVWVYYRAWNHAGAVYTSQAQGQALELSNEINELSTMPTRYAPAKRALLSQAIAIAYGRRVPNAVATWSTLADVSAEEVLPAWALKSLTTNGFAIGGSTGPSSPDSAEIVAWRVGPQTVRYYSGWWSFGSLPVRAPLGRVLPIGLLSGALILVLGLLGAWALSRSVVRPVRRLAEASGRLAEGERDVTVTPEGPRELRELAASFNDMNAKLTKAQEAEQSFLLSVSHELKTPLTSIRGYAEGLGDGTIKAKAGSAVIGAESGRLERLVGDLLDSARMRKSAFTVRREMVDLAALADDVARRYEGTALEAGLTLHLKTAAGGTALADADRALQAVSNLVENAIRCTPPPGTVTIATALGSVTVSDTGPGLTSDDLPRAFERFYLYDRYGSDRPVGTGLGLAIVKELTEAMGGTISVASAVGVGTAFSITLPQDGGSPTSQETAELPTRELTPPKRPAGVVGQPSAL